MSLIFEEVIHAFNSLDFNQILNIGPSGHVQAIHNVIKDTSTSQEYQNNHKFQQEL